jgi:DNA polymerase sigma
MVRIKPINSSKVPICKFADPEFGLACDINVNQEISLHNTELIRSYVAIDPRVRPLVMIVKYWTKCRVLNDGTFTFEETNVQKLAWEEHYPRIVGPI